MTCLKGLRPLFDLASRTFLPTPLEPYDLFKGIKTYSILSLFYGLATC